MDGKLDGKVVIDATNPLKWTQGSALERTIPQNVIAGRVMAQRLPTAHIVKAFTYAPLLESEAHRQGKRLAIAMAGDDETAKNTVAELIKDAGYVPVRYRNVRRSQHRSTLVAFSGTVLLRKLSYANVWGSSHRVFLKSRDILENFPGCCHQFGQSRDLR